jgi:hypothetical protein
MASLDEIFDGIDVGEIVASGKNARRIANQAEGFNRRQFYHWRTHLVNLYMSSIEWHGVPEGIDPRAIEYVLMVYGCGALFMEEGGHLFGAASMSDRLNINFNPNKVLITSPAGQTWTRHAETWVYTTEAGPVVMDADCALCWENKRRAPVLSDINYYAQRLARIDRVIDVNVDAQQTPWVISGSDAQEANSRALIQNLKERRQYIVYNNQLTDIADAVQVLNTQAPYVASDLVRLKKDLINEFLTSIGIDNDPSADKAAQRPVAEVIQNNEQVMIARNSRLAARRAFCERARVLFGLEMEPRWSAVHETMTSDPMGFLQNPKDRTGGNPYATL